MCRDATRCITLVLNQNMILIKKNPLSKKSRKLLVVVNLDTIIIFDCVLCLVWLKISFFLAGMVWEEVGSLVPCPLQTTTRAEGKVCTGHIVPPQYPSVVFGAVCSHSGRYIVRTKVLVFLPVIGKAKWISGTIPFSIKAQGVFW